MKRNITLLLLLIILTATIFGCSSNQVSEPVNPGPQITIPNEPETTASYTFRWDNQKYTEYLVTALEKSALMHLIPKDSGDFNRPENIDPVKFWGNILVEMAYFESKWKTAAKYKENFKDQRGKYIYSRGLFQLSIESGRGYKCPLKVEQDLHNPDLNIQCAVLILERWVKRDDVIRGKSGRYWRGGARYWAVLRGTNTYTKSALRQIKGANK